MHLVDDQRAAIRDTIEAIRTLTDKPPRGWESPGLAETGETLDYLAEAGIEYVCDLCVDDQPVMIQATPRPIVAMPYDVLITAVQGHHSDEILRRGVDHFDRLYKEGVKQPRVMAISIHPYLTGAPHRIKYLEMLYDYILARDGVVMWTGSEILDWCCGQTGAAGAIVERRSLTP